MTQEVVSVLRQLLEIDRSELAKGFQLAGTDAETFKKRVDRAMTDVEKTLDRPTQAVKRLETAMRGDRLLSAASNIVAAMDKVGGATKLSEAEQARYNATLQKAVEKYRLLGQEAPKALLDAEKATRRLTNETEKQLTLAQRANASVTSTIGQMAAGFTIANIISSASRSVVNLGMEAVNTADKLVDMSAKTGLSTEMLQRLDFVADQAGGTLEGFTDASFRLGVRLTSGSAGVNKAVADLNLNLAQLRQQRPDEQFMAIVDALAKVEDEQERNRIGVALFGKQYASIASSVAQNIREIGSAASVMSDETVKALADAKDEWGRFYRDLTIFSGQWLAGMRKELVSARNGWSAYFEDVLNLHRRAGFAVGISDEFRPSRIGKGDIHLPADKPLEGGGGAPPNKSAVQQLREIDAALAKLTKTQRDEVDAARELGGDALQQVMDKYDLTEQHISRYASKQRDATAATKDAAKALKDAAKDVEQFNRELVEWSGAEAIADAFKELELLEAAEKQGVTLEMRTADQIERSRAAFDKGIKAFTRLGLEVPAKIAAAFQRSAVALAANAEYIAKFSPMDTSGLTGSPVVGGMVGVPAWRQALMEADFAQGALDADLAGGVLDVSKLNGLTAAADGTLIRFKDLNYWMEALNDNLEMIDRPGRNFEGLIQGADMLARSLDQTGLSVSRMLDSVRIGWNAGQQIKAGGFSNVLGGSIQGAAALVSATGSGSRGSRILGGAATGAAVGSVVPGIGTAIGAGAGALIGWARSMGVPASEKEARAAFAQWQRQVIVNFEAMAKAQGLVTSGMDDWDKMVAGVAAAYAATGRTVDDVHRDLKNLTDATHKDAAAVMAALGKITEAFDEQAQDVEILNGALSEYGFALDEIGAKNINKTQTAEAKRLADQYRVLLDSGVDVAAVHERMSGSISKWLQDTMRTGAAIPSVMRPILENFAKQGQLIDANGLLMDQAAVSALDFKDTWVDGLDRVVVKLDQVLARFAQLLGVPADTLGAAQGNLAAPSVPQTKTFNTPFGSYTFQVPVKHMGGMVERAHSGAFMGSRRMPSSLFGRMAPDEMPMILQTGEGVLNRRATSLIGGPSAIHSLNAGTPLRDPFDQIGSLLDSANAFRLPAPGVLPTTPPVTMRTAGGGGQSISLTIAPGAISVVSPDADVAGKRVLDAVLDGVHNNTGGFRTKLIQKVGQGH